MRSDTEAKWKVLLIGGTSGIGKSSAARELAQRYSAPFLELDDLRIAVRSMVPREAQPALYTFVDTPDYHERFSNEEFVENLLNVGRALWPGVDSIISKHVRLGEKIIMEGDALIPEMLAQRSQEGVAAVFLYDEPGAIKTKQLERNRHGKAAETIDTNVAFSFSYSEVVRKQAQQHGFHTLCASPVETLADRIEVLLV